MIAHEGSIIPCFLTGIKNISLPILDGVMHESVMSELVDTGNQQSNKEVDWQKVFYVFWKYKNTKIKYI